MGYYYGHDEYSIVHMSQPLEKQGDYPQGAAGPHTPQDSMPHALTGI